MPQQEDHVAVGWLDLPALKYSIMINGVTQLFVTKSDVLSGFDTIKICKSYRINGTETEEIPYENEVNAEPVYIEMPGWKEDITGIRDYTKLPDNLRKYIEFVEKQTGVPITMVSVGPDRNETIFR